MSTQDIEKIFQEALAQHKAGAFDNAQRLYTQAVILNPSHQPSLNALYNIASIYAHQENIEAAVHLLTTILSFNSSHLRALIQLARIFYNQSKYSNSILYFKKALELDPDNSELHHDLGVSFLAEKKYQEAINQLEIGLELNPHHSEAHYHLATAYLKQDDLTKAMNHYHQQLSIQPTLDSYYNIGVILTSLNRHEEAIPYFEKVLELDPHYLNAHLNLGVIHLKFGRMELAIHHYQEALSINPDDAEISYILAGLSQSNEAPRTAPTQYLSHLFDQYALYYDKHLTEHLRYQVPEEIFKNLKNYTELESSQWNILDLGCGTGLSGKLLKPYAKQLIGVDISENMLDLASQKNIYTHLEVADITTYLAKACEIDFIIAADVFSYQGDLDALFKEAFNALNIGGYFIFSVERGFDYPYHLQQSLRYTHSKPYLDELIEKYHFNCINFENVILRHQQNEAVEGYLLLLRKKNNS